MKHNAMLQPARSAFAAWDARAYLADYYSQVEHDEQITLAFLVQEFGRIAPGATALVFGAGPTLHHLLPLAPRVQEMHAADYLPANLAEIRRWRGRKPGAHDWRAFTRHVLSGAGIDEHDLAAVLNRVGFDSSGTRIEVRHVPQQRALGYESIVLASGRAAARRSGGSRP